MRLRESTTTRFESSLRIFQTQLRKRDCLISFEVNLRDD